MQSTWKPARATHWLVEPDDFATELKAIGHNEAFNATGEKRKHYLTGRRGPTFVGPKNRVYFRQRRGADIQRGIVRPPVSQNFRELAVYGNNSTSPVVDIPTIIVETMRINEADMRKLRAHDLAAYWYLFAIAREQGIDNPEFEITVSAISKYLGVASLERIRLGLQKLGQTRVSYHFNQPDSRGRRSMDLIRITLPVGADDKIKGSDVIRFSLPTEVCNAALSSRGFGYVHINALARLKSKFAANLFVLQSIRAGMMALGRVPIQMTEERFKAFVGLPPDCTEGHFAETLRLIDADFQAVEGPRKAFDTVFERMVQNGIKYVRVFVGGLAFDEKTVANMRLWLGYKLPEGCLPSERRFQELATCRKRGLVKIASEWVLDVYDAYLEADHGGGGARHPIGMSGTNFLSYVAEVGLDEALEAWADHRGYINPIKHRKPPKKRDRRKKEKVTRWIWNPGEARVLQIPSENLCDELDDLEVYEGDETPYEDVPVFSGAADDEMHISY